MTAIRSVASTLLIALAFAALFVVLSNIVVANELSNLPRLTTDFSPTFLRRKLGAMAKAPPSIMVLGDSVLWGYRLQPPQGAVALLRAKGYRLDNLAFKGSSPPNYYAMLLAALDAGIRPKAILLEIDDKVLNPADDAYAKLNPSLDAVARPLLSKDDAKTLHLSAEQSATFSGLEPVADRLWLTYAMRADVRESLAGDIDAAPAQAPTPELYEGTYDLSPIGPGNVGVHYLDATLDLARERRIPVAAFLAPTNHTLLHDYIDAPEYRSNLAYLIALAKRRGAEIVNLDAAFQANLFYDNSHLKPEGQVDLAARLAALLELSEKRPGGVRSP